MKKQRGKVFSAPWEKSFDQILTPLEDFIHRQSTSGILLMLCAVISLVIANSQFAESFQQLLKSYLTVGMEGFQISKSLHHWINDGLMALFFLVVGLELKRELLVGELNDIRSAMLPVIAAVGGMVVPVGIYMGINPEGHTFDGWGIPMATDIAFALGALTLLGKRVPTGLLTFLVALAIVDDLGAVLIIAIFYTDTLNFYAVIAAVVILGLLITINLGGIRKPLPYILLGILLWVAMLNSGVHATLAGVFLAFTIPMRPKYDPERFIDQAHELLNKMSESYRRESNIIRNDELRVRVKALSDGVRLVQAPAQVLESRLHLPSAFIIIPIFSLANAGVPLNVDSLGNVISHPVSMGVILGLVVGKLLGVAGFSWLAVKAGVTKLPSELNFHHVIGAGFMAGIGFTMSIFIAELGFSKHAHDLLMAKTGILVASLIAGICGFLWLYFVASKRQSETNNAA